MSVDGFDRASSVGDAYANSAVVLDTHPAYQQFAAATSDKLAQIHARESLRVQSASTVVFTSSLSAEQLAWLGVQYPEFAVSSVPLNSVVHATFTAARQCANEWLLKVSSEYADTIVHFGGGLVSGMQQKVRGVHVEYDPCDEVMLHSMHTSAVDVHRLFNDYINVQHEYKILMDYAEYSAYVKQQAYRVCSDPGSCSHAAEALCVDMTSSMMSPEQVALAMQQHSAELCHGFFLYQPEMLLTESGELADSGVVYIKEGKSLRFVYPEGRAGAGAYDLRTWNSWLESHTFRVGVGSASKWYQLELLKNRAFFMFFRMVEVPQPSGPVSVAHALDFSDMSDKVLVKSWRLQGGIAADPKDPRNWRPYDFLASEKLVNRVYEYCMQVDKQQFDAVNTSVQVDVANDRFVVAGSTVRTRKMLTVSERDDLAIAIHARAFVDRYEGTKLTSEMMGVVSTIAGFHSSSKAQRIRLISGHMLGWLYGSVFGVPVDALRSFLLYLRNVCTGVSGVGEVTVSRAPTYMLFSSVANSWRSRAIDSAADCARLGQEFSFRGAVELGLPGGKAAAFISSVVAPVSPTRDRETYRSVVVDVKDEDARQSAPGAHSEFVSAVSELNVLDEVEPSRYLLEKQQVERQSLELVSRFKEADCVDPVLALNQLYSEAFPAMVATSDSRQYDTFRLALDDQERVLTAEYLRLPTDFGLAPKPRAYFRSKLSALNVPKRQNTTQELLTAVSARNLNAPVLAKAQDDEIVEDIWDKFLKTACVDDAKDKLAQFQSDPVCLAGDMLTDWAAKAKPETLEAVRKLLAERSKAFEEMSVSEYLVMLKSDVKPTLSDKPVGEVTAPQVIVYHERLLNALYSSIFRMLVRRFLSLLKPNFHVNLLKDSDDIGKFVSALQDYDSTESIKYLENDFSKYDKSQSEFAFRLEHFVFQQLGMDQHMLDKWLQGHVECNLRSVTTGMSAQVLYQRKSGDATTAFGNVIINVLSVCYAYHGTLILWAVFMGDDSIVAAKIVASTSDAIAVMAEVFNLSAKFYLTDSPYFASNFILVDKVRRQVLMVPDVIKRIERLSMHISAEDPQWDERWVSFRDSMSVYTRPEVVEMLTPRVTNRYEVPEGFAGGAAMALGALARDKSKFRDLWEDEPSVLSG